MIRIDRGGIRRALLAAASLACILPLTACWDRIEINDLGIVLGSSVDLDGNQIRFAVQSALPGQMGGGSSGGGGGTGGGSQTSYIDAETAPTIRQCMANMQKRMSRRIFLAHRRVIVVGEAYAKKQGINGILDELSRNPQNRLTTFMLIAKGKGEDLLSATPKFERFSSEAMRELTRSQVGMTVNLKSIALNMSEIGSAAVVPLIEPKPLKQAKGKDTEVQLAGFAQFRGGKMVGTFEGNQAIGLLWLQRHMRPYVTTIQGNRNNEVTLHVIKGLPDLSVQLRQGQLHYAINLYAEAEVLEDNDNENMLLPKVSRALENKLASQIHDSVESAIDLIKENKADSASFGMLLARRYPLVWMNTYRSRWPDALREAQFSVSVQAKIVRMGMTSTNISQKERRS